MPTLVLSNGTVVTVTQPTVANVTVAQPSRRVAVVSLPPGSGAGSAAYEYVQSAAASTWIIALPPEFPARRPGVDVYVGDVQVETDVVWSPSTKTITITFPSPTSGVAVIT